MKISVGESNELVLEDVFSGVCLRSRDREEFGICMRDSGFEFQYAGEWYEAKAGVLTKMAKPLLQSNDHSGAMTTGSASDPARA